jgi:hypothetical protein
VCERGADIKRRRALQFSSPTRTSVHRTFKKSVLIVDQHKIAFSVFEERHTQASKSSLSSQAITSSFYETFYDNQGPRNNYWVFIILIHNVAKPVELMIDAIVQTVTSRRR